MKKIFNISLFLISFYSFSQNIDENLLNNGYVYDKGSLKTVMWNNTKIRKDPNFKSLKIDSLLVGHQVKIDKNTKIKLDIGARENYWYKVSYQKGNEWRSGYAWGGNFNVSSAKFEDTEFLLGMMETIKKDDKDYINIGVMALKNGEKKGIETFAVENAMHQPIGLEVIDNKGLKGVKAIVRATSFGNAFGVPTYEQYILWTGEKLVSIPTLFNVNANGMFYHAEELIFPNEKNGREGQIILRKREFRKENNMENIIFSKEYVFVWQNETLTQSVKIE